MFTLVAAARFLDLRRSFVRDLSPPALWRGASLALGEARRAAASPGTDNPRDISLSKPRPALILGNTRAQAPGGFAVVQKCERRRWKNLVLKSFRHEMCQRGRG